MTIKDEHCWKLLIQNRSNKRSLKKIINNILINTNNETLLTNKILQYLSGYCNKCHKKVCNLKNNIKYGNICFLC